MRVLLVASVNIFPSRVRVAGTFYARLMDRLAGLVERIVVLSPRPYVPKVVRFLPAAARALPYPPVERRGRILIARPYYLPTGPFQNLGVRASMNYFFARPLALRLQRRHRFDVVLGYSFPIDAYGAARIAQAIGVPSVVWAIGSDIDVVAGQSRANMAITCETVRRSTVVLTESDSLRRKLQQYCPQAANIRCYYKGIDLDFLRDAQESRQQLRDSFGIAPHSKCMVSAGAMVRDKGVWEFFHAFRELAGQREDLCAILAGNGPEVQPLRQAARQAGLEQRFLVPGEHWDRRRVGQLFQAADLLVFLSHHEGLPNVVMEALAAGLPVVATDVGGIPEVVMPERTGLLVPPGDVPAAVAAIRRMLDHPDLARATAETGRELILRAFDVDKNALFLHGMLKELIAEPGWLPPAGPLPPYDQAP
jgi:teichuronic acid biosynthesis glycosyltransferase TuaC